MSLKTDRLLVIYNHHIPQRAINHQTPMQAQENSPELFVKKDFNHARLDTKLLNYDYN